MTQIKAVIFDMDGLMFDTEKIYYKSNQTVADELAMEYSFETYSQFIGAGYHEERAGLIEIYEDETLIDTYYEKATVILEDLLLNGPVDKKEGLIELLEFLQEKEIPAVVASSTHRELVDQLLERLEVRKYFKDVVGGDEVATAKPDPAIFNKAFEKTGLRNKNEAIVLEDSKNGILAAHAANIPVILIPDLLQPDAEMKEKATAVFKNLHEMIPFLKENAKK